ncbi:hypothetical protein E2C01_064935 [Portunus trituberculatus]|uniref:Uncharacterized protein n=1 Tax=Portunus trituberculatus TaxID=210409 RepID=A0A5B7HED3_PORTR|nr:hypothetical protein [Portunus trituberculatus]
MPAIVRPAMTSLAKTAFLPRSIRLSRFRLWRGYFGPNWAR